MNCTIHVHQQMLELAAAAKDLQTSPKSCIMPTDTAVQLVRVHLPKVSYYSMHLVFICS
jgi:hypothetical protein